jgi:hypothetical protein
MTVRRRSITVALAPREDGVYEDARALSILTDKQTGHELAIALGRLEQTTLHIPDSIRDLKLALDAELIADPMSRRYMDE